jgi:serine/threonine protein kinase
MAWRLMVIDGADQGRFFPLAEVCTVIIGNSHKHSDICLNDLYVARVHCHLVVTEAQVVVTEDEPSKGTFVNGQKVTQHELHPGDVLRVGNSHLRLEIDDGTGPESPGTEVGGRGQGGAVGLPLLALERLAELSFHTLGHFEIGGLLGRGHYGVVFHANDLKTEQAVALKILSPEFPRTAEEMRHFAKVMKEMLALRHPHLVAVSGAGKTGPYCWIAMEYVEGESLAPVIARGGKTSWKQALRVALHVGRALDFAHQHRLVHGNITPANILIRTSDRVTKLGDLMFATALEGSQLQLATLEAKLLAELAYLAPEQTPGEGIVDSCTDLHCLGAVVYGLLTGRPPFVGESPAETIEQIREAVPLRPREFQESIPGPWEGIVLRMLAKHPEERFLTPAELLAELEPLAKDLRVKV